MKSPCVLRNKTICPRCKLTDVPRQHCNFLTTTFLIHSKVKHGFLLFHIIKEVDKVLTSNISKVTFEPPDVPPKYF